jgi:hypothetical protein
MTRSLSAAAATHVEGETTRFAILMELRLDSGDVNIWSGVGDLSWDSKTWQGLGAMGGLSGVAEATDLSDTVTRATLSHIPIAALPDFVEEFKTNNPVGREYDLFLALLDSNNLIEDVIPLTSGFIDGNSFTDGEEGAISLDLVSEATKLEMVLLYRLSAQHQDSLFPGDLGLEFVTDLDEEIRWGGATPQRVGGGGGSRGDSPTFNRIR